jgi:hypothetical protein
MNFVMRDVDPEEKDDAQELQAELTGGGSADEADGSSEPASDETEFVATGEKKRMNQTAMMLFAILAIGGAGIFMMYKRVNPKAARAADPVAVQAQATISEFMQKGNANVTLLRRLLDGTAQIIEQFKHAHVVQVPLSELKSNPFQFTAPKPPAAADDGSEAARKRKEQEKLAIQGEVRSLQLQSLIVRGNRKACMINNTMYQEGEAVDDFTIESISSEGVVVKKDNCRFRIQIAAPAR